MSDIHNTIDSFIIERKRSRLSSAEVASPVLFFLCAIWFVLFAVTDANSKFTPYLSGYIWGIIYAAVGILKFVSVHRANIFLRIFGSITAGILWLIVVYIFVDSNYKSLAVPISTFLALMNFLRIYELKQ